MTIANIFSDPGRAMSDRLHKSNRSSGGGGSGSSGPAFPRDLSDTDWGRFKELHSTEMGHLSGESMLQRDHESNMSAQESRQRITEHSSASNEGRIDAKLGARLDKTAANQAHEHAMASMTLQAKNERLAAAANARNANAVFTQLNSFGRNVEANYGAGGTSFKVAGPSSISESPAAPAAPKAVRAPRKPAAPK